MKFEVNEKVFAFTMLLYGQQLFIQMFNEEADKEWKLIQPILKQLYEGLKEKHKKKGYQRALDYSGSKPPVLSNFYDLWFILYCISNYRIFWIDLDSDKKELMILKYALNNVAKKSHRTFSEYKSRHI